MARPIVLSNGELHVGINDFGLVHDFYYPYVGLENHAADNALRHHVGVWVDGTISWLDDGSWQLSFSYPHNALIGHTVATHKQLGITVEFDDMVDAEYGVFMRNIHVINNSPKAREVRLFMHQAFIIGDSASYTDTVQYLPDDNAMLHYRGRRAFIISGQQGEDTWFDQYTCGLFGIEGHEGTYKDAEDGELTACNVEHGRVDSTLRFVLQLAAHESGRVNYWIACGTSLREALYIHKQVLKQGYQARFTATAHHWHIWLAPAQKVAAKLKPHHRRRFTESLMILKSHIDKRGAVIAGTDTAILDCWRDAYAYVWPRDGAYAVWPLIRLGYYDEPYRFFEFCRRGLTAGGYLSHKYRADGALGSSWQPYLHANGDTAPPIQTDETALVLFVFAQFYHMSDESKLLHDFYEPMVVPMANFLASYIDSKTHLPRASYDLWEENYMTTTYTTAVTYAALLAAAGLAEAKDDTDNAVAWRTAADSMGESARSMLYNPKRKAFYKGYRTSAEGPVAMDETIDMSAVYGAFMFGLYSADSKEITYALRTALIALGFDGANPGIPRYEGDIYLRQDATTPNWWPIVTLWYAQYCLETGDAKTAEAILAWVDAAMGGTAAIPEQIAPQTGKNLSVEPLTWSQAEYISTLLDSITEK